jgi:hypothetical protein
MTDVKVCFELLTARKAAFDAILDHWADSLADQHHLDRDTSECAYWHSGYHQALSDVLAFAVNSGIIVDSEDKSKPRLAAG